MSGAKASKASKPSKRDRARHGGKAVRPPRLPAPAAVTGSPIDLSGRRSLADWPVVEAFVSDGWDDGSRPVTVFIARRHPRYDTIETGLFLVDLQCLGVKSATRRRARDEMTYERELRPLLISACPVELVPIAPELAAKIVLGGLAYAEHLGLKPDPDFAQARIVLDGLDPAANPTPVPLGGPDGKPHFVAGPYDDAAAIMNQLQARLGPDGFHYLTPLDAFDDLDAAADLGVIDDDGEVTGDFVPLDIRCPELAAAEPSFIDVVEEGDPDDDLEVGRYPLREMFCTDLSCDCHRVILRVLPHDAEDMRDVWPEATIGYSWASDEALQHWMGGSKLSRGDLDALRGPVLELAGFQGPGAETLLELFRTQLLPDPDYIARLARHYAVFRAAPRSELEQVGGGWSERGTEAERSTWPSLWRGLRGLLGG